MHTATSKPKPAINQRTSTCGHNSAAWTLSTTSTPPRAPTASSSGTAASLCVTRPVSGTHGPPATRIPGPGDSQVAILASAVAKLMHDGTGLTFLQLRKVAQCFGRGVLFFLDPEPVDANRVHTAQYRTLTGQKPDVSFVVRHLIERVERQRELYLSLREEMTGEGHPTFEPPDVPGRDVGAAAQRVRNWLGLAGINTFEGCRDAVERKRVLVFRSNGYAGRWQVDRHNPILGFSLDMRIARSNSSAKPSGKPNRRSRSCMSLGI